MILLVAIHSALFPLNAIEMRNTFPEIWKKLHKIQDCPTSPFDLDNKENITYTYLAKEEEKYGQSKTSIQEF